MEETGGRGATGGAVVEVAIVVCVDALDCVVVVAAVAGFGAVD